jgi:hypothetical protein
MHNLTLEYTVLEHFTGFRIASWQAWHGIEFERFVFPSYRSTELPLSFADSRPIHLILLHFLKLKADRLSLLLRIALSGEE